MLHLCAVAIYLVGTVYSNCICVALIDSVLMVVMFLHAGRQCQAYSICVDMYLIINRKFHYKIIAHYRTILDQMLRSLYIILLITTCGSLSECTADECHTVLIGLMCSNISLILQETHDHNAILQCCA